MKASGFEVGGTMKGGTRVDPFMFYIVSSFRETVRDRNMYIILLQ